MGAVYAVNGTPAAITVAADLVEITPADDRPVRVIGFRVWQTTDVGDTAEEIIGLSWTRGNATSGSGGSASTPVAKDPRSSAAGATCEVLNTTQATAGTPVDVYETGWNVRAPLEVTFTPEQYIRVDQGQTLMVLRMLNAPADSLTIGVSVDIEEI